MINVSFETGKKRQKSGVRTGKVIKKSCQRIPDSLKNSRKSYHS